MPVPTVPYRTDWLARFDEGRAERAAASRNRGERIRTLLPALVHTLVGSFGAQRVWLVGSAARGTVSPDSDIDLVVEGLAPTSLVRATVALESLTGSIPVDLIPLEDATPRLHRDLERDGIELHAHT